MKALKRNRIHATRIRSDGLTERQADILRWIVDFTLAEGTPPTYREAMASFGIHSPNGFRCHVIALVAKGALCLQEKFSKRSLIPCGLRLVPDFEDTPAGRRLRDLMQGVEPCQK